MEIIRYHEKEKSEVEIEEGQLVDFLGLDPRKHLEDELKDAMDEGLKWNFMSKLFKESFLLIERGILQRRMSKIYKCNKFLIINCVECSSDQAVVFCSDCDDHFCKLCSEEIHQSNSYYKKHNQHQLDLNPLGLTYPKSEEFEGTTVWRKFEYFNFPLPETHDQFESLALHFEKLKHAYVDMNYINEFDSSIDFASVFVDQNYDGLERNVGREMKKRHMKEFGMRPIVQ